MTLRILFLKQPNVNLRYLIEEMYHLLSITCNSLTGIIPRRTVSSKFRTNDQSVSLPQIVLAINLFLKLETYPTTKI